MSSPLAFSIVPCVLLALTLACGDSTDPGAAAGTYVLQRIDQDPVPAVVFADETYAHYIVSDTIRFLGANRGTISGVQEVVPLQAGLPAEGPVSIRINFRYATVGEELEFEFECPPNANCAPGPHLIARHTTGGLIARWGALSLGRSPLVYIQVNGTL